MASMQMMFLIDGFFVHHSEVNLLSKRSFEEQINTKTVFIVANVKCVYIFLDEKIIKT